MFNYLAVLLCTWSEYSHIFSVAQYEYKSTMSHTLSDLCVSACWSCLTLPLSTRSSELARRIKHDTQPGPEHQAGQGRKRLTVSHQKIHHLAECNLRWGLNQLSQSQLASDVLAQHTGFKCCRLSMQHPSGVMVNAAHYWWVCACSCVTVVSPHPSSGTQKKRFDRKWARSDKCWWTKKESSLERAHTHNQCKLHSWFNARWGTQSNYMYLFRAYNNL